MELQVRSGPYVAKGAVCGMTQHEVSERKISSTQSPTYGGPQLMVQLLLYDSVEVVSVQYKPYLNF